MSTTTANDLDFLAQVKNPLKFIHLKDLVLGEFGITYHVNDGFVINELSRVSMKEQLLFQKMVSRNQQLNLMMVDSIFPLMMAEMATVVLMKGPMTFAQYVQTGNPIHGEFLMEHKLHQFIHHLLYADVAAEKPFKGTLDYERVYYRNGVNGEIEYYSIYEQRALEASIFQNAIIDIDHAKSILEAQEARIVLRVSMVG
jgi:hypothetical protein